MYVSKGYVFYLTLIIVYICHYHILELLMLSKEKKTAVCCETFS